METLLGRRLMSALPDGDSCHFGEGEVIGCEIVVPGGETPTLLDRVEEPVDEASRTIQVRTNANRLSRLRFGGMLAHARCWRVSA
jgi:hypothetical protein